MAVVQSINGLVDLQPNWTATASYGALRMYDQYNYDYATLYRTQSNVRSCVDFLARNIAQLGLHVFRRVSETDRQRLRDHPLAVLIGQPNGWTTRYRLINSLISDLGIYDNAYWWKLKSSTGRLVLVRVPPTAVDAYGDLVPTGYLLNFSAGQKLVQPAEIVHFRGYNPINGTVGLSPLETLRRILAEEFAAGDYREYFWKNAARQNGIIERPREAPEWSDTARERFKSEFEALYSGGPNSGRTAILEEGMIWKQMSFSAQESEYLAGRKLTREECARAYHIPLPMIGILDNANFSNMQEAHKQLYQDCLGPWLAMTEDEISLQLLPDLGDTDGVYVEFNIQEKLQGSFQEQVTAFQSAVGRPYMTADEARARLNMPSLGGDAARLVTPLNVLVGGQASPRDSAPDNQGKARLKALTPADWQEAYADGVPHWAEDLTPSLFAQQFVDEVRTAGAGRRVLEIGCGNGRDSILFARAGFIVNAIDAAPGAVDLARQNAAVAEVQIDFRVANAEQLPFADGAFDALFSLSVLHASNLAVSIPETARVLAAGGLALIYIYGDTTFADGRVETYTTVDGFLELLKGSGYEVLDFYSEQEDELDEYGEKHRILVAHLKRS
ncbi:MAG: phage portal protein [Pseudomonadota bacterium]